MMEKGEKYLISFDYTSTADMDLKYKIQQNYGSYTAYESGSVKSTSETGHFETEFTSDVQDSL